MKYKYILLSFLFLGCTAQNRQYYSSPETPWDEALGNHRAVLQVDEITNTISLDIVWRRHDINPEQKQFIIIHKESGDTIKNIHRIEVNNERCQLVFGPVEKTGRYHFYYLPYIVRKRYGNYNKGYFRPENKPAKKWLKENGLPNTLLGELRHH